MEGNLDDYVNNNEILNKNLAKYVLTITENMDPFFIKKDASDVDPVPLLKADPYWDLFGEGKNYYPLRYTAFYPEKYIPTVCVLKSRVADVLKNLQSLPKL